MLGVRHRFIHYIICYDFLLRLREKRILRFFSLYLLFLSAVVGAKWLLGRGPGISNHFEAGGFICGSDDRSYPNVMFHFLPLAVRYDGSGGSTRCDRKAAPKRSCAHFLTRICWRVQPWLSGSRWPHEFQLAGYGTCGIARRCRQTRNSVQLSFNPSGRGGVGAGHSKSAVNSQSAGF